MDPDSNIADCDLVVHPFRWPYNGYQHPVFVAALVTAIARASYRLSETTTVPLWLEGFGPWHQLRGNDKIEFLACARLAEGVELIHVYRLVKGWLDGDTQELVDAMKSKDFVLDPDIADLRALRLRHNKLTDEEEPLLDTNSGIVPCDNYVLRLLPPPFEQAAVLDTRGILHLLEEIEPAAQLSKKEEINFAIEMAAQELRENPKFKRDGHFKRADLYDRLFGPLDKRAPHLKNRAWVNAWTPSLFKEKVWKKARVRAERAPVSPKGRRPE